MTININANCQNNNFIRRSTGGTLKATQEFEVVGSPFTFGGDLRVINWRPSPVYGSGVCPNGGIIPHLTFTWRLIGPVNLTGSYSNSSTSIYYTANQYDPGQPTGINLGTLPVGSYTFEMEATVPAKSPYYGGYPVNADHFALGERILGGSRYFSLINFGGARVLPYGASDYSQQYNGEGGLFHRHGSSTTIPGEQYFEIYQAGSFYEVETTVYVDEAISYWNLGQPSPSATLTPLKIEVWFAGKYFVKEAVVSLENGGYAVSFTAPPGSNNGVDPYAWWWRNLAVGEYQLKVRVTAPPNALTAGQTGSVYFTLEKGTGVTSGTIGIVPVISSSFYATAGPRFSSSPASVSIVDVLGATPSQNIRLTNAHTNNITLTDLAIVDQVGNQSWQIGFPPDPNGIGVLVTPGGLYPPYQPMTVLPGALQLGSSSAKLRISYTGVDNVARTQDILLESTTIPPDLDRTGEFVRYPEGNSPASETTVPNLTRWNYLATFEPSGNTGDVTFSWIWDDEYLGPAEVAKIQINGGAWVPFSTYGYAATNPGSLVYTNEQTGVPVKIYLSGICRKVGTANFTMDITAPNVTPVSFPDTLVITEPVVLAYPRAGGARYRFVAGPADSEAYPLSNALDRELVFNLKSADTVDFKLNMRDKMLPNVRELETDIKVYRDDVKLIRARVGPSSGALDTKSGYISFNAFDYRGVLARRFTEDDDQIYWYNEDVGVIIHDLLAMTQGRTAGDLGIAESALGFPTLGTIREEVEFQPGSSITQCIDTIAQSKVRGFDWYINPQMELELYGERGEQIPKLLEYQGAITSLSREYDTSEFANAARASGGEIVDAVLLAAPDLELDPRGRWEAQVSWPDVETQEVLNDRTQYLLEQVNVVPESFSVTLREGFWRGPDHIWMGDYITVKIDYGNFAVSKNVRVHTLRISLNGDGGEKITLELK